MRKKNNYSKDDMFRLIREWEASGISQVRFSNDKGIAKSTFGYWRKKYLREKNPGKSDASFIPVKVDAAIQPNAGQVHAQSDRIELSYPNGVRLTCSDQIDFSRLKMLIVL